jgi:hypothetical protein
MNLRTAYLTTKLGFVDISLLYVDSVYSIGIFNNDVDSRYSKRYPWLNKHKHRCLTKFNTQITTGDGDGENKRCIFIVCIFLFIIYKLQDSLFANKNMYFI